MLRFVGVAAIAAVIVGCDGGPAPADAGGDGAPGLDAGVACGEPDDGDARAVFALDEEAPFFDLPWPNDLRRGADGHLDMGGFPNPGMNTFVLRYLDAIEEELAGFGTNGAVYFRFSRAVDPATLPATPEASLENGASVLLVDIDPESPDVGTRHPVVVHYQDCPTRFWAAQTVALRPVYGIPLASDRTYAAVVTSALTAADGESFGRDADFDAVMSGDAGGDVYAPLAGALEDAGIDPDTVISAAVFTTQDAIGETLAIRDWIHAEYPAPAVRADSLRVLATTPRATSLEGTYGPVPIFQEGTVPYATEGGAIDLDASGAPTVHGEYDARFTLSVPGTPMPADGYPIVLYAHGTGGDYRSSLGDEAAALTERGIAVMGVDQIHHGARNPTETDPAILFFNIPNPQAARDNNRQSALDVVTQARLVASLDLPTELVNREGAPVRFDPERVLFMGHSQGGLNGPIFLAIDDAARGAVLSAASAIITPALIEKVEPLEIPEVVRALLNLPGGGWEVAFEREGFTVEHPIATILQTWLEVSDGANYAHLIFRAPREGFAPKSVLMTEGLLDEYAPPRSIEALAGAMFVPPVLPVHQEMIASRVRGTTPLSAPVSGNVAGGAGTAGLLQFADQGHFAIYDSEVAATQVYDFLASLVSPEGGPGTIPAAP